MDGLERIKQVNLEILDEIRRVADLIGVRYFLLAGTMLGAARKSDFIPWDDDADVGMLRADYEKFIAQAPKYLGEKFELVFPEDYHGFYDMIAKVTYRNSRLHDPGEEDAFYGGMNARISVDLYILDAAAPGRVTFAWQIFRLKMVYGMMMRYRYQVKGVKYSLLEHAQVLVLTTMGHFRKLPSLRREYGKLCRKYEQSAKSSQLFVSNSVLQKIHVRYEKTWFDGMTELKIRNHAYAVPTEYEAILQARYGADYMVPKKETFTVEHAQLDQVWVKEE